MRAQPAHDVIVIGGGAAGMIAAGRAAESGASVVLLEKMPRLGIKLRITGKGRCNITNTAARQEFIAHFGREGRFLNNAFGRFFRDELLALLKRLDLLTKVERGGRVFPESDRATDVVMALERYMQAGGVDIRLNQPALGLSLGPDGVHGVRFSHGALYGHTVIVAAGGASYPGTGSTGDAYAWLESAGHTVHAIRPALVPLETAEEWSRQLAGLSLRNVRVSLLVDNRVLARQFGEMLFTHFGVSGPIILSMSTQAVDALPTGVVQFSIDLKPALSDEELDARLQRDLDTHGKKAMQTIARELLPMRLIYPFLVQAGVSPGKPGHQITSGERRQLARTLRDLRVTVTQARPFREAMITAGGVELKEIDPKTMESHRVKHLYIVGELLNLHADTGGYNLQAAFSTGYVAGQAAAEEALRIRGPR
jgi:predicted Rossmann fold flavoprotein